MELIHSNDNGHSVKELSLEQLISPSFPKISGITGDPQVNPRVGIEYQAELPPMISESEHSELLLNPLDVEGTIDGSHSFLLGLPFSVTWVRNETNNREQKGCKTDDAEGSCNENGSAKSRIYLKYTRKKDSKQNVERVRLGLGDDQESKPTNLGPKVAVNANLSQLHKGKNYDLVPGLFNHGWGDVEINSFILGLYIFGKSFLQIKRFMECKETGHILSYYYGDFYASSAYHRWSDCARKKRKKCIYGEKLFTGWRHQELMSRLHPHVPEHHQDAFLKVSAPFSEEKFSLDDYVSNLKAVVGIQALVDAIGIGKGGKEDLTNYAMELGKNNPLLTICPNGKEFSSLTYGDIVKLLTGGFRLSKARCNDIFWEAVWPRLLAKGWHSEQPKDQIYLGSNNCLVFLIPGVEKFSRRKHVKGNHYFDSVTDVLNKVATEPTLIELETEEAGGGNSNNERGVAEVTLDRDDSCIQQPNRYLKPRVSQSLNLVRFTVVDSGSVGGKLSKLIEMRYAPRDLKVDSLLTTLSNGIEMTLVENPERNNGFEAADTSTDGPKNMNKVQHNEIVNAYGSDQTKFTVVDTTVIPVGRSSKVHKQRYSPGDITVASETTNSSKSNKEVLPPETNKLPSKEEKSKDSMDMLDRSHSEKKEFSKDILNKSAEGLQEGSNVLTSNGSTGVTKRKYNKTLKCGQSNNAVPVVKRRRLTACTRTEIKRVMENLSSGLRSKPEASSCAFNSTKKGSNAISVKTSEGLSATASLVEGCQEEGDMRKLDTTPSSSIDLPKVELQSENQGPTKMHVESTQAANIIGSAFSSNSDKPHPESGLSVDASDRADQPDINPRRQSTRKRPLTAKALEALECGFLGSLTGQNSMNNPHKSFHFPFNPSSLKAGLELTSSGGKVANAEERDTEGANS